MIYENSSLMVKALTNYVLGMAGFGTGIVLAKISALLL